MPAPLGHPLWGNPLNPKKYTPEELWQGALDYFDWCKKHPVIKKEQKKGSTMFNVKGDLKASAKALSGIVDIPTDRPYSLEALCNHLDICFDTFVNYSKEKGYETYFDVCKRIKQIIDAQHFEGGMVGNFNANIVTRKLGLAEKQQNEINLTMPNIEVKDNQTKEDIEKLAK
jgi:hypothetical protein